MSCEPGSSRWLPLLEALVLAAKGRIAVPQLYSIVRGAQSEENHGKPQVSYPGWLEGI